MPKTSFSSHVLWMNALIIRDRKKYQNIRKNLLKIGYEVNTFWKPLHLQKYSKMFNFLNMKNTNYIWNKILTLPSSTNMTLIEQKKIIKIINKIYR